MQVSNGTSKKAIGYDEEAKSTQTYELEASLLHHSLILSSSSSVMGETALQTPAHAASRQKGRYFYF